MKIKIDLIQEILNRAMKGESDKEISKALDNMDTHHISAIRMIHGLGRRYKINILKDWKQVRLNHGGHGHLSGRLDFSLMPIIKELDIDLEKQKYEFKANKISKNKIEIILREKRRNKNGRNYN